MKNLILLALALMGAVAAAEIDYSRFRCDLRDGTHLHLNLLVLHPAWQIGDLESGTQVSGAGQLMYHVQGPGHSESRGGYFTTLSECNDELSTARAHTRRIICAPEQGLTRTSATYFLTDITSGRQFGPAFDTHEKCAELRDSASADLVCAYSPAGRVTVMNINSGSAAAPFPSFSTPQECTTAIRPAAAPTAGQVGDSSS